MSSTNFRKQGPPSALNMFEAEAEGLAELKNAGAIRVPEVYDVGTDADSAYIEMERLDLQRGRERDAATLGAGLAALHRHTADLHGWHRDNTIGSTPQHNPQTNDWVAFFRDHRLQFQLDLAARNGYAGELQDRGKRLAGRLELYKLYHVLNHLNLFGSGYLDQALAILRRLTR
jgi:fructosamine-3-kinase